MIRFVSAAAIVLLASAGAATAGCKEDIAKFQKLIDGDLKTGFIAKGVYDKVNGELKAAAGLCKSGQDAAASSAVASSRARHGYPAASGQ
ncbi:hypothetical protein IZ6_21020 [Terrihabitans soli]|uniref:Uncharacterized protein n=1 Tax=Terrihabitans soli TaxID=708113 RepID=A0A6S6QTU5_9HYPH|nr:hypothetical protein [Terrihabitans soli]BCJ91367.1 hypothetical protein IZ6_21020 [Terrihabitans soli]